MQQNKSEKAVNVCYWSKDVLDFYLLNIYIHIQFTLSDFICKFLDILHLRMVDVYDSDCLFYCLLHKRMQPVSNLTSH